MLNVNNLNERQISLTGYQTEQALLKSHDTEYVNTIDDLKALVTSPKRVFVSGFYSTRDGYFDGSYHELLPDDGTTYIEDGDIIVKTASNRYYKLNNAEQFADTKYVDTIDDLKALTTTPKRVFVSGYYSAQDNAFGSLYHELLPDDGTVYLEIGGVVIKTAADKYYRLKHKNKSVVLTSWFGCVGGDVDETQNVTAALQYSSDNLCKLSFNSCVSCKIDTINIESLRYIDVDFNGVTISPYTASSYLFYARAGYFEKFSFHSAKFDGHSRIANFRYTEHFEHIHIHDNTFVNNEHALQMLIESFGVAKVQNNKFTNISSDYDIGVITLGSDVTSVGTAYIENNNIDGVQYVGDVAGTEVHGIIAMCTYSTISSNKLFNIRTSQPQTSGCEPIYTKASGKTVVTYNTIQDSGAFGGAITIKGAGTSLESSLVASNTIHFSDGYTDETIGIQLYTTNVEVFDNKIYNPTGIGIVTASTSSSTESKNLIKANDIIGCKAASSIRVYLNGDHVIDNNIIFPNYSATGNGIYVTTTGSSTNMEDVYSLISGNTITLNNSYSGYKFYAIRLQDGYDKLKEVTCTSNMLITQGDVSSIAIYMYGDISINSLVTKFTLNDIEADIDRVNIGVKVAPYNVHGTSRVWSGFPTVGTYKEGEKGYYYSPATVGYTNWVCTASGDVGGSAVFINVNPIEDKQPIDLPSTNPGSGKFWADDGVMLVGTDTPAAPIIKSNTQNDVGASEILNIVYITRHDYDLLTTKEETTLYCINEDIV